MLQAVKNVLKIIFFKLYLNLIGAVYLVKENVVRPRRLPDYSSQGESRNYTLNIAFIGKGFTGISFQVFMERPVVKITMFSSWPDNSDHGRGPRHR